ATRAMAKLTGQAGSYLLVGHSQGGHAVLAAQALAASYGHAGDLRAVVAFAPVWFPMTTFASIPLAGAPTSAVPDFYVFALYYFYGHGELWDGPGHGTDMIRADKRAQVRTMMTTSCDPDVTTLGQFA